MLGAARAVPWREKKVAGALKPEMAVCVREEVARRGGLGTPLGFERKYSRLLPGDRLARR